MVKIDTLSPIEKAHWELHLNAVLKDNPSFSAEVEAFLKGSKLPDIKHPAHIHRWFEEPESRSDLEVSNG